MARPVDEFDGGLLSDLALQSLSRNAHRLSESYVESQQSVVLLADLAGFSQLGAQLIAHSERGAEQLHHIVNGVFGQASDCISLRGGRVLYYAGDSIIVAWPISEQSTLVAQAGQAIACGLEIQSALARENQPVGKLTIRTTVAAGEISVIHIAGGAAGPRILFDGDVLEKVAYAPKPSHDRGVLVLPQLLTDITPSYGSKLTLLADDAGTLVTAIDQPLVVGDALAPKRPINGLSDYLPSALRERSAFGAGQWLAEFRSANILFACFPWDSLGARQDLADTAGFTNAITAEIDRNGGELIQFCKDDKGLVLLAGWGLAASAYENGAERAIRAAQEVSERATRWHRNANIAVTTGKVFVGLIGGRSLYQHVMVGDPVNRATAIAVQRVGPVIIDDETRQSVGRRFLCTHTADLAIKGHAAPLPVYSPGREVLSDIQHMGSLVARASERERLERVITRIDTGECVNVHLFGDAGLGKSRLAKWYEERLSARGVQCLRMNADALRQTIGFTPWKQVFTRLLGLPWNASADRCQGAVKDCLGEDTMAHHLVPLLGPVLPNAIDDNSFTATLVGAGRAESTRTMILTLLTRLLARQSARDGRPTVLLVEDAHWLDSASWQMLELVSKSMDNVCLAIASRPLNLEDLPSESRHMFTDGNAETFTLQPLSREDTVQLVCQTLDAIETSMEAIDVIYRAATGHPLFTTTLAISLLERGLIVVRGGYAHLKLPSAGLQQLSFPDGVEGTVRERIAALTHSQQIMLKVASVLGRNFDLETLSAIYPISHLQASLAEDLAAIAQTALIEVVGHSTGHYRFHHAIIEDTAYRLLVTEQREALHLAAGLLIEQQLADAKRPPNQSELSLLAHHFERASDRQRAINYLAEAGENARVEYNNREVVDFLTRALEQANHMGAGFPNRVTLGEWLFKIGDALRALGEYQPAESFLKQCASLLDRPPPETRWQVTSGLLNAYLRFRLSPQQPVKPQHQRLPIITAAAANALLSEIHYELNKIPFALQEILHGGNLARFAGGDSATLSRVYIGLALTSTMLPWALNGEELQKRSLAIADRLGDPSLTSWVYMVSGTYETGKGGWKSADTHLNHAREVGDRCGERKIWETAMSCLGNLKRLEGRFEQAKHWSDLTMEASRDRGIVHGIIWSHNGRARDLLCLSRLDEAAAEAAALEKLLNDPLKKHNANDNNSLVYLYTSIFCALHNNQNAVANMFADKLMSALSKIKKPQVYMVQNVDYYSDILWSLWKRDAPKEIVLSHQALVAKSGAQVARQFPTGRPMAELALGDGAWFRGKTAKAVKHWRASAELALGLGMSYNAAHALYRIVETDLNNGKDESNIQVLLEELNISRPIIWSI